MNLTINKEGTDMSDLVFSPNDINLPTALRDVKNVVSVTEGYRASRTFVGNGTDTLDGVPNACHSLAMLDGSKRTFVSSNTGVYELIDGEYTQRWEDTATSHSLAALGDVSIMTNNVDNVCYALSASDFLEIADAPVAKIVVEASGFLLAFDYVSGSDDYSDGWWSSNLYDYTTWTPSVDTNNLSANGRLLQTPGAITAAVGWNDKVLVFKENSMYIGTFTDIDSKWTWEVLRRDIGCVGMDAVTLTPYGIIWLDKNSVYMFDGNSVDNIGSIVQDYYRNSKSVDLTKSFAAFNDDIVYVGYPGKSSTTVDNILTLNMYTKKWGRIVPDTSLAAFCIYTPNPITIDGADVVYSSYDSADDAFDSLKLKSGESVLSAIGVDGVWRMLTGSPSGGVIAFYILGDDDIVSLLTDVIPHYRTVPTTSYIKHEWSDRSYSSMSLGREASLNYGRYNIYKRARWHTATLYFTGEGIIENMTYVVSSKGTR